MESAGICWDRHNRRVVPLPEWGFAMARRLSRGQGHPPFPENVVPKLCPRWNLALPAPKSGHCTPQDAPQARPPPLLAPNSSARTGPSSERWKKVINLQRKKC